MKLCILGNEHWSRVKRLQEEAEKRKHQVYRFNPDRLLFSVEKEGIHVMNDIPWKKLDAIVVFKRLPENDIYGWVNFVRQKSNARIFFNHLEGKSLAKRSFLTRAYLAEKEGVRTPKTIYFGPDADLTEVTNSIHFPMVVKRAHSSAKRGVRLVESETNLYRTVEQIRDGDTLMFAREFIPHEVEWRVIILNGKPIVIYERQSRVKKFLGAFEKDAIRNSRGPKELPDVVRLAKKTASALKYELSGIDIVRHQESGELYMLDANPMPVFEWAEKVSGINVGEILIKYIEDQV